MNKTLLKIIEAREDLSDYLFHFTKNKDAIKTLEKITDEKSIIDINKKGVICFTEAPLLSLVRMFEIFDKYQNPMYAPYGVAIKKDLLFNMGGRPVIYGSPDEKELLNESIKWRFESFHPTIKDFTWLREWRVPKSKIDISVENCFVITKTKNELYRLMFNEENLIDIEFDGCVSDGQFWGSATGIVERSFKGISIEDLKQLNLLNKSEIEIEINNQNENNRGEIGLGGFIH